MTQLVVFGTILVLVAVVVSCGEGRIRVDNRPVRADLEASAERSPTQHCDRIRRFRELQRERSLTRALPSALVRRPFSYIGKQKNRLDAPDFY